MAQTSYSIQAADAFGGLLADFDASVRSSISRANEETAAVGYGRGVTFGTDPDVQFLLPAATGFEFAGVLVHAHEREDVSAVGPVEGETAELLRRGRIWVVVEEAVTPTDDVFLRHTAGVAGDPGSFRTDDPGGEADQVTNARWLTTTAAAGLAVLDIGVP